MKHRLIQLAVASAIVAVPLVVAAEQAGAVRFVIR